ncbi:uncharacterized protein PHALS_04610 [Plasmopara halstedii]|uniref:Uncharacterized protein n=1 Tax=Plasmopara halstedii TaxID=4781 RepID=A0A0P1AAI9_PLAHL|nr:uncharacterized protein PHALS_04610 [Plasmopara halstedii]CEG37162.1 hypothetical protein PHALS_04610 [Plasmopara halstedii]|eukprot:XP_024573531.1 hypothetical protein PHALS_04610 [Plasmopara halstedii]
MEMSESYMRPKYWDMSFRENNNTYHVTILLQKNYELGSIIAVKVGSKMMLAVNNGLPLMKKHRLVQTPFWFSTRHNCCYKFIFKMLVCYNRSVDERDLETSRLWGWTR